MPLTSTIGGGDDEKVADESYLTRAMLHATTSHFWVAVHHADDPVMCASFATASRMFLGGYLPTAPQANRHHH
jgi:hypothetical protein